jgi:hypothetical protein
VGRLARRVRFSRANYWWHVQSQKEMGSWSSEARM